MLRNVGSSSRALLDDSFIMDNEILSFRSFAFLDSQNHFWWTLYDSTDGDIFNLRWGSVQRYFLQTI